MEYERFKSECTVSPKVGPNGNLTQSILASLRDIEKFSDDKFVKKEIERLQKGRLERERVKKFTERGVVLNSNHQSIKQMPNTSNNMGRN